MRKPIKPTKPRSRSRRPYPGRRPRISTLGDAGATVESTLTFAAPLEPLMTPKDVANRLNYSLSSVRRLVNEGALEPVNIAGKRTLRFHRADVEELIARPRPRRRKPPAQP